MGKDKCKAKVKLFVKGTRVPVVTEAQPAGMSVQMPLPAKAAQGEFAQKEVKATISMQEEIDAAKAAAEAADEQSYAAAETELEVQKQVVQVPDISMLEEIVHVPMETLSKAQVHERITSLKKAETELEVQMQVVQVPDISLQEEIVHVPKETLSTAQVHEKWLLKQREQLAWLAKPARCRR